MITEEQIQVVVRRIVEGYAPDRIILFGSYAYGVLTEHPRFARSAGRWREHS